jgi:serine O-acetyltransferase
VENTTSPSSNDIFENQANVDTGESILGWLHSFEVDQDLISKAEITSYLNNLLKLFSTDVSAAYHKDPAAESYLEVFTSYPGIKAILLHRIAHFFYRMGIPFIPRYLSDLARKETGIEIHPGAKIGSNFFIDHGLGTVIGETAVIGDNCTLYHNVTLGGTSLERKKRHPTLGNNVIVGSGASILGPVIIGNNVKIGSNSVVLKDIPDDSVVVGIPGRVVKNLSIKKPDDEQNSIPNSASDLIKHLETRITVLEEQNTSDVEHIKNEFFCLGEGI